MTSLLLQSIPWILLFLFQYVLIGGAFSGGRSSTLVALATLELLLFPFLMPLICYFFVVSEGSRKLMTLPIQECATTFLSAEDLRAAMLAPSLPFHSNASFVNAVVCVPVLLVVGGQNWEDFVVALMAVGCMFCRVIVNVRLLEIGAAMYLTPNSIHGGLPLAYRYFTRVLYRWFLYCLHLIGSVILLGTIGVVIFPVLPFLVVIDRAIAVGVIAQDRNTELAEWKWKILVEMPAISDWWNLIEEGRKR